MWRICNPKPIVFLSLLPLLCAVACSRATYDIGEELSLVHRLEFSNDLDPRPQFVALISNQTASLTYSLGPSLDEAVGGVYQGTVSDELVEELAKGDTTLHVKFECSVCEPIDSRQAMQRVKYSAETIESSPVTFRFTPIANIGENHGQEYPSDLPGVSLLIVRDGINYDRIDVPVTVVSDGAGIADEAIVAEEEQPRNLVVQPSNDAGQSASYRERNDSLPDVTFNFEQGETKILLRVLISDPTLQDPSAPIFERTNDPAIRALNQDDTAFLYQTGFENSDHVNDMSEQLYLRLSCLTVTEATEDGKLFREAAKREIPNRCKDYVEVSEVWNPEQLMDIGKELENIGRLLFDQIAADEALKNGLMRLVDVAKLRRDTNPIKIGIRSFDHLPFQLLHPPEKFDPDFPAFFGYLFEMASIQSLGPPSPSQLKVFPKTDWDTVFGGFAGDSRITPSTDSSNDSKSLDLIASFARSHYQEVNRVIQKYGGSDFKNQTTSLGFLDDLFEKRSSVDLIWTYLHGDGRGWSGNFYPGLRSRPKLIFGWTDNKNVDLLTAGSIQSEFSYRKFNYEGKPLSDGPLVVLIACESGAAGPGGTGGAAFRREFFGLGARGLLTTEAEIHAGTASLVGADLVAQLVDLIAPSRAILNVRLKLLEQNKNMWPLFFHYHGALGVYAGT